MPSTTLRPSTVPSAPLPVGESKSVTGAVAMPRSSAAATIATASGCSLARSTLAARRSTSALGEARRRHDRGHRRLALGQGAGLVDDERVDLLHVLERFGVLDEHAGLRAAADADHDRHRRGEAERAGTGDDEHRDRGDEAVGEARLGAPDAPRPRRPAAATTITAGTNQPETWSARRWIGARLRCASATSCTICDSMVSRPTFCASITSAPVWFMVPPMTLAPTSLVDRHRLAGDHRLVDGAAALDDRAVDRHLLAGTHAQAVADLHGVELDLLLGAVRPDAPRRLGREVEQRADGAARALAGAQLEHLPEQHEHGDDGGRLEVDRDRAVVAAEGGREDARRERRDDAVDPGDARAHGDQREHVEVAA